MAVAALCLLVMPQLKYASLHASFFDLGQYASLFHSVAFGGEAGQAFQSHAHPLIALYLPIYRLLPSPATLLALQSLVLVGSGVLAGLLWRRTSAGPAIDGALIYFLSAPVWFAALFDFHFEHMLVPIFFGAMLASLSESAAAKVVAVTLGLSLCLVKESYALMAFGWALYLAFARGWMLSGAVLAALSLAYFLVATEVVIPYYSRGRTAADLWAEGFGHLGSTTTEIMIALLGGPLRAVEEALNPRKLLYLGLLGGAFAFLWLRSPWALLPCLPLVALALLSRDPNHFYIGSQYSVAIAVVLFAATALAVARFPPHRRSLLDVGLLACSLTVLVIGGPSPVSRLFLRDLTWNYGCSNYVPTARDAWVKARIEDHVPSDGSVAVATQNTLVTDRLASRRVLFAFPHGVLAPLDFLKPARLSFAGALSKALANGTAPTEAIWAEWVALDLKRELYLGDRGCAWLAGRCTDREAEAGFMSARAQLGERYELVFAEDALEIFRRRPAAGSQELRPAAPAAERPGSAAR